MGLDQLMERDLSLSMPIDGIRLIEASAGTGKTFTIAGLYARLVIEKHVPLRNILVMTFTRAACDDLRKRLRERLQLCALMAEHDASAPDAPEPTPEDAEQRLVLALLRRVRASEGLSQEALRRRINDALNRMDEAVVVTIHGFCQRVLDEHAAQLDGGGQSSELESSDLDLLEDIAADLWLQVAGEDDAERLAALQQLARSPADLAAHVLRDLVYFHGALEPARPASVPPAGDMSAVTQRLLDAWQRDGGEACRRVERWFAAGHHNGTTFPNRSSGGKLHAMARCLMRGELPGAADLARFSGTRLAEGNKKNTPAFEGHPAFDAIDTWIAAHERQQAREQVLAVNLLHELVKRARSMLEQRKRELRRMSYDDQIERLHAGLHGSGGDLVEALRHQFPYAMVDEFQDTSPRQFEIFRKLYQGHGSLMIIGDPKQAIYGFRGGDVHAYLEAAQLKKGKKESLKQNFRSSSALLEAIAALFAQRGGEVFIEHGIEFEPVTSGLEPEGPLCIGGKVATPMTLWQTPKDAQNADDRRAAMAQAAAAQIAGLLDPARTRLAEKPLEPGKIAVLVNTHAEVERVLAALRALNIPAVGVQKQSVFSTLEAGETLRLLDALLAPESLALARGALATGLVGKTLGDLRAMQQDENAWHAQIEWLAELRRLWFRHGLLAMMEQLIEQRAAALLALPEGERRLANLMQLAELLQEAAHRLSGQGVVRDWLARHVRDADDGREDEQLRLETDARCVQVMTLHKSKGLEFDAVLLPFMAMREVKPAKKGRLARFHRGDEPVRRLFATDRNARSGDDEEAAALAHREQLAEDVRLLYVGVTRARHACWMSVPEAGTQAQEASDGAYPREVLHWVLNEAPDGSALSACSEHVACLPMPVTPLGRPARSEPLVAGRAREFTRALRRDWWVHSFSQLNRGEREVELDLPADREDTAAPALIAVPEVEVVSRPRGADYGNAVHAILEHADFAAWHEEASLPESQFHRLQEQLRMAGFSGRELAQAETATERLLRDSLNAPFIDNTCLVDLAPAARRAEMRFHFGIAGADPARLLACLHEYGYQRQRQRFASLRGQLRGLMHGIIDMVCLHQGRWWVIDYKTNHLGDRYADYQQHGMQMAIELHGYDLQYLIYTVAVHRWLRQMLGGRYDYERDFGGVRYLFLRGMQRLRPGTGVFADRPPAALITALDALLEAPRRAAV